MTAFFKSGARGRSRPSFEEAVQDPSREITPNTDFVELDQLAENLGRGRGFISQNKGTENLLVSKGRDAYSQIEINVLD